MIKKKPKGAPTKSGTHPQNHQTQSHKKTLRPSKEAAHPKSSKPPLPTPDAVREYLPRGLAPVPIPKGKKGPIDSGWLDRVVTNDTVSDLFDVDGNVGIRTGPKSGDHVDVDVDDKEALELAELLLPTTAMTSGREGQGPSHYWYIAPGAKTTAWKDELGMIVELRADGVQTLVPPSVHENGDRVVWYGQGPAATTQAEELKRHCALFACAMTLGRHWPSEGNRHDATLGVAGMLLQAGLPDGDAKRVLLAAAARGGDEQAEDREAAIATTRARIAANEPIVSGGRVKEHFGDASYKLLRKWLAQASGGRAVDAAGGSDGCTESSASQALASIILELADDLELFHLPGDDSEGWASALSGGRRSTFRLRSSQFRSLLNARLWRVHRRTGNPAAWENALATLEARAIHEGPAIPVELRVSGNEQEIHIDIGEEDRNSVHVTPDGWKLRSAPPVRFFRPRGMLPFPLPERGGTLDDLREFVNIGTNDDWLLFQAWLIYTFQSQSDFVILTIFGEHDSAKSTVARLAKEFTDPGIANARPAPTSPDDLAATAKNSRTMAYDNLSVIPEWLADSFCRLATGTCFSGRKYFTNEEEYLIEAKRPVVINAIPDVLERPDLIDRVACIWLPPIRDENRIPTAEFKARLEVKRARIFGALLDALSGVLKRLPDVKLQSPPRMADFARWGTALEQYLGYEPGSFLRAYGNNRATLLRIGLDDLVVLTPLRLFLKANKGVWEGTALALLGKLNSLRTPALDGSRYGQGWPRTPGGLSSLLRRHRRGLESVGVYVTELQRAANRARTRGLRLELRESKSPVKRAEVPTANTPLKKAGVAQGTPSGMKNRLKKLGGAS
jgi:hypothetical protein